MCNNEEGKQCNYYFGFFFFFFFRDDERQKVCLDIVYKMLSKLKPPELKEFLPGVTGFISHPSVICRRSMYDILMWIYDNYRCVFATDVFQRTTRAKVLLTLFSNLCPLVWDFPILEQIGPVGCPGSLRPLVTILSFKLRDKDLDLTLAQN